MKPRYQLGDYLPLISTALGYTGAAVPTAKTINAGGSLIETISLAGVPERLRGFHFEGRVRLGGLYSPGKYALFYQWTENGEDRCYVDWFEIAPGGNSEGNVTASYYFALPEANSIIYQLDGGSLKRGLNPHLPAPAVEP